jgi:uncharacterized membrane protein YedE/YeeE
MNRIFRFYFGIAFFVVGIIASIFRLQWGYGILLSTVVCEIFSYIGDRKTDKKYRENKVVKKSKFRIHHYHTGALLMIISLFYTSSEWWVLFFSFSLAMFLHDALYHICVALFKVDQAWQKRYLPKEDLGQKKD